MSTPARDAHVPASTSSSNLQEPARQVCIHQLFQESVRRNPNLIAAVCGSEKLTFADLNARAETLAVSLQERGVGPDVLVGLCVERSLDMVIGLLGILKAGGAYVPLDPAYPRDRIRYILEDARVKVLVTQEKLRASLAEAGAELEIIGSGSSERVPSDEIRGGNIGPNNLAYVIYTSGSTGRPKGVQIEHGSVVNFLCSMQLEPGLSTNDVLVAVTTLSFDIAGLEMYLPLITGARLVIANREETQDGRKLAKLLQDSGATVMQATPATWRLLIESGWEGKSNLRILCGGEALSPELARELVKRAHSVWNLYGPTETTIWSSAYQVRGDEERSIPIGRPIANTMLYVLGEKREPLPFGEEGELYIGGSGLARGYFERPELTAEKFVQDPFAGNPDVRMYRTGDLARYRSDGQVEFLGRIDHQVKIRGFRIELGEIEAVLEQHPAVNQAVVIAREDRPGDKFLAAYVAFASGKALEGRILREHLQQQLPDYMIPLAFVPLQSFPMTPNAKVDRKALPAPKAENFGDAGTYLAPRDETERKLVHMWEEVLGIRPIGVKTNFFDIGGRSVVAAKLFMQISREFGEDVPLAALFESPTIEQLARRLRAGSGDFTYNTIVEIQPSGSRRPFFCVHGGTGGTLFLHRLARAMGPDQRFYAFQPEGVDGGRITRKTIEEMAAHYIAEMRKIQPEGPYFIGGYCLGGNVAFEMAQQLLKQGVAAEIVAMFSAPLRFNRPAGERRFSPEHVAKVDHRPRKNGVAGRIEGAVRWRVENQYYRAKTILEKLGCRILNSVGIPVPQKWRELYIVRALLEAEKAYIPKLLNGTIVLFRGSGLYDHDPGMGWSTLATEIDDRVIGTTAEQKSRRDILNEPLVAKVAEQLRGLMDSAPAKSDLAKPAETMRLVPKETRPQDAA